MNKQEKKEKLPRQYKILVGITGLMLVLLLLGVSVKSAQITGASVQEGLELPAGFQLLGMGSIAAAFGLLFFAARMFRRSKSAKKAQKKR